MTNEQRPTGIDISVIIVNYNSGILLKNCIESLYREMGTRFEVIVYDNASGDESLNHLEDLARDHENLKIIRGTANLGFAKANNLAAREAKGKFLHFLNPDIIVNHRLADDYKHILANPIPSIHVTSLTDPDGHLQKNRHLIPRIGNMVRFVIGSSKAAYWNLGASILIETDAFRKMGGWPEEYFMYVEDLDFFYTAYKQGIPVCYTDTRLIHIGQGVTMLVWNETERARIIEKSFKKYFYKYNAGWEYILIRPIQLLYILFNEPRSFPLYFKTFIHTLIKK